MTGIISSIALFLLILDSRTALSGARNGIMLCIFTIIPSLFPFFVLSALINSSFSGFGKPFKPIRKLCGMPKGSEKLFLLGFLGGYPVGAQSIYQAYKSGQLSGKEAKRLLSFCSNAGPAFIFGMIGCLFSSPLIPWILWAIHIISAILVALLLPQESIGRCLISSQSNKLSVSQAAEQGVKITASICGWVIIFRIIFSILDRWILWLFPAELKIMICGFLELSNGCIELMSIESEGLKFILSSCFLSFGGLCVIMQTSAVTKELGIRSYITGKIMQCSISLILSTLSQWILFPPQSKVAIPYPLICVLIACISIKIIMNYRKNSSRNLAAIDV